MIAIGHKTRYIFRIISNRNIQNAKKKIQVKLQKLCRVFKYVPFSFTKSKLAKNSSSKTKTGVNPLHAFSSLAKKKQETEDTFIPSLCILSANTTNGGRGTSPLCSLDPFCRTGFTQSTTQNPLARTAPQCYQLIYISDVLLTQHPHCFYAPTKVYNWQCGAG